MAINIALATDAAVCAARKTFCHWMPPPNAFSGTTSVSPGCSTPDIESPENTLFREPITEPSARITKIAFLLASCVGPPDWPRYHFALLPGRKETAVGLKTCPVTITKLGRFGIGKVSPARTLISALVSFQLSTFEEMRMVTRPSGGLLLNCSKLVCHCCSAISFACLAFG